jgi:hypothetical protein
MIEALAAVLVPRSFKPVSILKVFIVKIEHNHGVDVARPKLFWKLDFHHRPGLMLAKEHERTRGRAAGEDGEINAIGNYSRAEWKWAPASYAKPLTLLSRIIIDPRFHAIVMPQKRAMPLAASRQV